MLWSHAGPNQRVRPGMTQYLANASLTPISIGYDALTVPESNKIEKRNAEVCIVEYKVNSITLGWQDLNRLRFYRLPDDEDSPRRFCFEIENLADDEANAEDREDESEIETVDSSDGDLLLD